MVTSSSSVSTPRALTALALAGALSAGLSASVAVANVDNFFFESFEADYQLQRDDRGRGHLVVREVLVAQFPDFDQNRGIARALPLWFGSQPLNPEITGVSDAQGEPRSWETYTEDEFLWVESVVPEGSYVLGRQVYQFDYTMENVIGDYSNTTGVQEFYWDINGTGWPQYFDFVSASVSIGPELAPRVRTDSLSCYVGQFGDTSRCAIEATTTSSGGLVVTARHEGVGAFETMTIAVAFDPETFSIDRRPYLASPWLWFQVLTAGLALWGFVRAWRLRRGVLADAPGRPTIVPEYLPPEGVSLIEAAIVRGTPSRLLQAALLELAVSKRAVLIEDPEHRRRWQIQRTTASTTPPQEQLLAVLFDSPPAVGDTQALPKNSHTVGERFDQWWASTKSAMASTEFFRTVSAGPRVVPIVLSLVSGIGGVMAGVSALGQRYSPLVVVPLWLVTAAAAVFGVGFSTRRPLGTRGAEARDHLKGLSDYIELAEEDRLDYLQSPQGALRTPVDGSDSAQVLSLYERLLPWAVLLGHQKRWSAQLERLYRDDQPPVWIVGNTASLNSSLGSLGEATSHAARSSSSGGSGGGGSAGGGGGGGGGGGR